MDIHTSQAEHRIRELTRQLNHHNYLYYVVGQPEITDLEFDRLLQELQALEHQHPDYRLPDSPTQRVGGQVTREFPVFRHLKPMKSLENIYSEAELQEFHERVVKGLGIDAIDYVAQLKIDGVALSLHYEDGVLVRGVTRGDGVQGDDITANVRTIASVPLRLHTPHPPAYCEIRGEVYMNNDDFARWNHQRLQAGEPAQANPRNATAGTLKLQDSAEAARRPLRFMAYYLSIESVGSTEVVPDSDWQALELLKAWGFQVAPENRLCSGTQELMAFIRHWATARAEHPYETDGVVIKVNRLEWREELGVRAKNPRWAVAYKYAAEQAIATLESIEFSVGRTGFVTPVANLSPVALAGTTVKRASLYNFDEIQRLDLHIGDRVVVEKSGEIIPKVMRVVLEERSPRVVPVEIPSLCPACATPLQQSDTEVGAYCPNLHGCPPQVKGRIEHFASRKALDIDGLGSEIVGQLVDAGLVRTPADLYDLQFDQLITLERFGQKSAENLLNGIARSKERPFARVLFGLGIRFVGEVVADKLTRQFKTIDALAAASPDDIKAGYEIGERIAQSVATWLADPANKAELERLRKAGLQLELGTEQRIAVQSNKLAGKKCIASGSFEGYDRDGIKNLLLSHGAIYVTAISKQVDYFIIGEKVGPAKLEKAQALGLKMLSLAELQALLAE
jgi:DNA ligase (NAD+)